MRTVGVRELKEQASEVLRWIREQGEEVEITYRGHVVARLVPVERNPPDKAIWTELDALADEISQHWPENVTASQAVDEVRREL